MPNISILDCTLRDGGYVNNWEFGEKTIEKVVTNLEAASIEYIECGFLSRTKSSDENQSIFKTVAEANSHFKETSKNNLALMVNCGEFNPADVVPYSGGAISIIRIAFHKHQRDEAQRLFVAFKQNGYTVFFQPMFTLGYSDSELLSLILWANSTMPSAFYIVDSFGTMRRNDVLRIFYLFDNNLDKSITIGFHSHNNLQLSFSNAQELVQMATKRNIIIDTSVLGMGRGAGNLCTELLTQYINEQLEKRYNIISILEIMDEYIMPFFSKSPWGYSAPYYLAAANNCHPNYATFLINRQSLYVKDIDNIIRSIPEDKKHLYDAAVIENLYTEYLSHNIKDEAAIEQISTLCKGRNVLVIAPGKSVNSHREEIDKYISDNKPVVFCVNHIPDFIEYDRVFLGNLKRFKDIDDAIAKIKDRIICTSNISDNPELCLLNYSSYLNDEPIISDNSGLMFINVLKKAMVSSIALAGYDGFDLSKESNYYDSKMITNSDAEHQVKMNLAIRSYFRITKNSVCLNFITPTIYNGDAIE